jgi:phage repressor protein C with HTH and peptisase S24 domain
MDQNSIRNAMRRTIAVHKPQVNTQSLALELGLSYNQLVNMLTGRTKIPTEIAEAFRQRFSLPTNWLGTNPDNLIPVSVGGTPMARVKIVGSASAGPGITNVDVSEDEILVPERLANLGGIGFIVDGDSMMPALQPGDVTLFREARVPIPGYPFLIKTDSAEYKIKVLVYAAGTWNLSSLNPTYQTKPLAEGDEIVGILVGWYRSRGSRETMDSDPNGLRLD